MILLTCHFFYCRIIMNIVNINRRSCCVCVSSLIKWSAYESTYPHLQKRVHRSYWRIGECMLNTSDLFIIGRSTAALLPLYVNGYLYTKVIDGGRIFMVERSPRQIIRDSMHHYGHGWDGAVRASRAALGNISMAPVKISGKLGIYWFPTKSPYKDDCFWFALDLIEEVGCLPDKSTEVKLFYGQKVTVPLSPSLFNKRKHRALDLKTMYEKRTSCPLPLISYAHYEDMQAIHEKLVPYEFVNDISPQNLNFEP